jgi:predicted nucleic acid-binding protein
MPVVDASVAVDWVAPGVDPDGPAGRWLDRLVDRGQRLLAPRLFLEEVSNALLTGIRRRRWSGAEADVSFDLLSRLPVELVDTRADLDRAWELSRRYDEHPVYDMVYVAVAERVRQPFITADSALVSRLRALPFVELLS